MNDASVNERVLGFMNRAETTGSLPRGAGVAVAVVRDGDVIYSGTYGARDRDRGLPVTPETVFEIGSLTKAFTSTAVLMASDRGLIDLDQPVNRGDQLLRFNDPIVSRDVSLADMLSHRTGLPANDLLWYFGAPDRAELFRAVSHLDVVPGAFRSTFIYNNIVYGVLGHLFEKMIGNSWESEIAERILGPLRMSSTSLRASDADRNVALPYVGVQRVKRVDMTAIAAAGGMKSSLADLTRWMAFHLGGGTTTTGGSLLSASSFELMRSRQIEIDQANPMLFQGLEWLSERRAYGLGWFLGSARGLDVVYHPAFIDGFSAALVMLPAERLGFVVLTNVNLSGFPGLLIREIVGSLSNWDEEQVEQTDREQPASRQLSLVGAYEDPGYGVVSLTFDGQKSELRFHGESWPLTWIDETTAELAIPAFGLTIPLALHLDMTNGRTRLSIPFSLDPRVGPRVFTRL